MQEVRHGQVKLLHTEIARSFAICTCLISFAIEVTYKHIANVAVLFSTHTRMKFFVCFAGHILDFEMSGISAAQAEN